MADFSIKSIKYQAPEFNDQNIHRSCISWLRKPDPVGDDAVGRNCK